MSGVMMAGAAGPLYSVIVTPSSLSDTGDESPVVSRSVTAFASPAGSYTYAWTFVSGDSAILAISPSSSTTAFQASMGSGSTLVATYRCTVTTGDLVLGSVTIQVTLNRT